jgi:hypothetical protein
MHRFNHAIPDLLTADGEAYTQRTEVLREPLCNMLLSNEQLSSVMDSVGIHLSQYCDSKEPLDTLQYFTLGRK